MVAGQTDLRSADVPRSRSRRLFVLLYLAAVLIEPALFGITLRGRRALLF